MSRLEDGVNKFGLKEIDKYPELEEIIRFAEKSPLQPYINYVNQLELRRTAQRGMDEYRKEMERRMRGEEKEYVVSEEKSAKETKVEENKEEKQVEIDDEER